MGDPRHGGSEELDESSMITFLVVKERLQFMIWNVSELVQKWLDW